MDIKLLDSELKVMEILWERGDTAAKEIAKQLNDRVGWSKTTTYTVIKKCINKLVDKMFDGSSDLLIASLLGRKKVNQQQFEKLRQMIKDIE